MTVRETALALLLEYEASGKYVNLSLSSHKADALSPKERSFLTVLLYTAVERKLTYDYIISALTERPTDKLSPRTKNILRLGLSQIMHIDSVPDFAAVNETVKLAKGAGERAFVNGVLRRAVRDKGTLPLPKREKNEARYLSVAYSFPLSLVKKFIDLYGIEEAEELLSVFNTVPPTSLSVNTLKISREDFKEKLEEDGFAPRLSENSKIGIKLPSSANPCEIFGFEEGLFYVQDEASAIAVEALDIKAGETVVDVCSCPGGKSFAAYILSGGAEIFSFDLHESKLSLVRDGARRLGIPLTVMEKDATSPDEKLFAKADKLICDVPCSGLGVLAKKPDLRYKDSASWESLPALQLKILSESLKYLKLGGEAVYSTCTLNDKENEEIVKAFLAENPSFVPVDFTVGNLKSQNGMLTLLPHKHGTDGFFIAKLRKTSEYLL